MLIIAIIVAIFILWHFLPQRPPETIGPEPKFRSDFRLAAEAPNWRETAEEHCESPAETEFLRALISAFDLRPQGGSLRGGGLKIDWQVEEGCYRVDFLANEWLVIEIDGAAYHSSADAQKRDRVRDRYFESLGYSVLRIPAKTVFNNPDEAIRSVRSALGAGKRQIEAAPAPVPISGFTRLRQTGSSFMRAVEEINTHVARERAISDALTEARKAAAEEKLVIETALEIGERQLKIDAYLDTPRKREIFEQSYAELAPFLDDDEPCHMVVSEFPPMPSLGPNAPFVAEIEAAYSALAIEREKAFGGARDKLRKEPRLRTVVENTLSDWGCLHVWSRISQA